MLYGVLFVAACVLSASKVQATKALPRYCNGQIRHVRIAVGNDPTSEMIVSFASIMSFYQFTPIGGVVIGTSLGQFDTVVIQQDKASSYSVPVTNTRQSNYEVGDALEYRSPNYHHVVITGLEPNTTYYYRPVVHSSLRSFASENASIIKNPKKDKADSYKASDKQHRQSRRQKELGTLEAYDGTGNPCIDPKKIRSFRTAPKVTAQSHEGTSTSFAVLGDLGQYPHSQLTLSRMLRSRHETDAIILAGDLAYSRLDHRQWDTFLDFLDDFPIAEYIPMMIVPGNHDIDKLETTRDIFLAYEHRFRMPRVKPPMLGVYEGDDEKLNMDAPPYPLPYEWGNAYYAWTYGLVRTIMVNAYASMEPDSIQYEWIVQELSNVDRERTPWLVVVIHVPIYNTFGVHRHDLQIIAARQHLEPVFVKYGVNVIFSGHVHAYSRTAPVSDGRVDDSGPIHIVVGAGGRKCEAPFRDETPEPYMRVRDATFFGYGMFRVHNATVADWEWIHTGHADDHDRNQLYRSNVTLSPGPAVDKVTITNYHYPAR